MKHMVTIVVFVIVIHPCANSPHTPFYREHSILPQGIETINFLSIQPKAQDTYVMYGGLFIDLIVVSLWSRHQLT